MATIGKTIKVLGDVVGAQDLVVEGVIEGTVEFRKNRVVIAAEGAVRGDLYVASAQINGRFTGNIFASDGVELGETAVVEGSILCPRVAMAAGGTFNGSIDTAE